MYRIENYKENWYRELLNSQYTKEVSIYEYGFKYYKDHERDELDNSTIFNVLLKTKRFRAIEFRKEWITLKVSYDNGKYLLLVYNKRKTGNDITDIFEINSTIEPEILEHIEKIIFPEKANMKEKIKNKLIELLKENTKKIEPDFNIFNFISGKIIELKVSQYFILEITFFYSEDGIYISFRLYTVGGDLLKIIINNKLNSLEEIEILFFKIIDEFYDKIKETKRKIDIAELILGNENENYIYSKRPTYYSKEKILK